MAAEQELPATTAPVPATVVWLAPGAGAYSTSMITRTRASVPGVLPARVDTAATSTGLVCIDPKALKVTKADLHFDTVIREQTCNVRLRPWVEMQNTPLICDGARGPICEMHLGALRRFLARSGVGLALSGVCLARSAFQHITHFTTNATPAYMHFK